MAAWVVSAVKADRRAASLAVTATPEVQDNPAPMATALACKVVRAQRLWRRLFAQSHFWFFSLFESKGRVLRPF